MADISDEIIMLNVKEGNLSEMSVLFERYHLRLYNFFLKLTSKRDISQDLTQNLFYRMIKYKHTYKSDLSVKSWIYQIARNLHNDYCREQKKSEDLFIYSDIYPSDVVDEKDSYGADDYEKLYDAFKRLSDEQKQIIVLSRYQGLKYEEISAITNQSVPAIKVAVHRAIKRLRGVYFKQI